MTRHLRSAVGLGILLCAAAAAAIPRTYDLGPNLEDNFFRVDDPFGSAFSSNQGVAPSADGAHVYVASGPVIEVLEVDAISGKLRVVQEIHDGDGGATIAGAQQIAVSPDGAHVYATSRFAPALLVFERDALTGQLTYVESQKNGVGGVSGLGGPSSVIVSQDGAHVYATSIAGNAEPGSLVTFARDALTGALTYVQTLSDGADAGPSLADPERLAISPDGFHVYVTAAFDDALSVYARNVSTGELTFVETHVDGAGGVDGLDLAFGVAVSADGAHVYAVGRNDGRVSMFSRNSTTGALTFLGATAPIPGFNEPEPIVLDAAGTSAYVGMWGGIARFARNPVTGVLTFVQTFTGRGGNDLNDTSDLAISPDDAQLYAAARALVTFDRDAGTGTLAFLQRWNKPFSRIGLTRVAGVAVSPDGAHVYATGNEEGAVLTTSRDGSTGALTLDDVLTDRFDGVSGLAGASGITISPDGAHAYVAAAESDSITAFALAPVTGALTQVDQELDGVAGVQGLDGVQTVAISPDGAHLYASGPSETAIAVFARNAGDGTLAFVEAEPAPSVTGLAVSPDGSHVYAATRDSAFCRVSVFSRSTATGALTALGTVTMGLSVIPGTVRTIAVSPDGANVYATCENLLVSFARDAVSGSLSELGRQEGGTGTLASYALMDLQALLVTADGSTILAANAGDGIAHDPVSIFARSMADGRATFVQTLSYPEHFFGFDGLPWGGALAESPDGTHVYWGRDEFHALTTLVASFSGCDATPRAGCRTPAEPGRAALKLIDNAGTRGDSISWNWQAAGETTASADFGDPRAATHYALCAYDESGPSALVFRALAPAGTERWKAIEVGPEATAVVIGYKMKDTARTPEGLNTIVLKSKAAGHAKIKLKGKGDLLALPAVPPPLPLRVQLQADGGSCWEATFSNAGVSTSVPGKFIAKSD